jgi:hypothetical protein
MRWSCGAEDPLLKSKQAYVSACKSKWVEGYEAAR